MNSWSVDPVGGPWFAIAVALLLLLVLAVGPATDRLTRRRRTWLLALRTATALLLLLAMWRPTLVATETRKLPGSLVILVDSSRSMQVTDSLANQSRWDALKSVLDEASDALRELAETWDLKLYRFDESTEIVTLTEGHASLPDQPDGPQTAIGSALEEVLQRETQQRLVAVLLLSDGAQRAYAPRDVPPQTIVHRLAIDEIPLYTIVFGKPALGLQSDLRVDDLLVNDTVFAETPVTVQATIGADGYANRTHKVELLWETAEGEMEVVDTREVLVTATRRRQNVSLTHTPLTPGEYKISVRIESPEGELAVSNNSQSTFVSVQKGGVNVLYLAGATRVGGGPGIEPRFVRAALAAHADLHVRYDLFNYAKQRVDITAALREGKYNVYLLADLDVTALSKDSWRQIAEDVDRGAGLAMLGGFHSFGPGGFHLSPLGQVLPIQMSRVERQNFGEPPRQDMHVPGPVRMAPVVLGGKVHPILQLSDDRDAQAEWSKLPPFDGINRFDRRRIRPISQVIAESDDAQRWPILITGAWGSGRTVAFAADSTWRWQLEGFGDLQRRFWRQLVMWLARKDDTHGQSVWVRLDGRRYQRGSRVEFSLGAFDEQGESLTSATFDIKIEGPTGNSTLVRPTRRGETLVATFQETSEPGDYRVTITATDQGQLLGTAEARFTIPDRDMELDQPAAEPTLLASLANLTADAGGAGLAPEELPQLLEQLKSRTKEFEEEISQKQTLWDTWPMLLSIVGLLSGEWWLRKRWGLV